MFYKLLLPFILIPFIELAILIRLGQYIGLWPTLALVIVTGTVGTVLTKREGLAVVYRIREALNQGTLPGRHLIDGFLILLGGILLITPGILTDVTGFLFILPITRYKIRERIINWLRRKLLKGSFNLRFF
jgi:UPF0716 protein FxsA